MVTFVTFGTMASSVRSSGGQRRRRRRNRRSLAVRALVSSGSESDSSRAAIRRRPSDSVRINMPSDAWSIASSIGSLAPSIPSLSSVSIPGLSWSSTSLQSGTEALPPMGPFIANRRYVDESGRVQRYRSPLPPRIFRIARWLRYNHSSEGMQFVYFVLILFVLFLLYRYTT